MYWSRFASLTRSGRDHARSPPIVPGPCRRSRPMRASAGRRSGRCGSGSPARRRRAGSPTHTRFRSQGAPPTGRRRSSCASCSGGEGAGYRRPSRPTGWDGPDPATNRPRLTPEWRKRSTTSWPAGSPGWPTSGISEASPQTDEACGAFPGSACRTWLKSQDQPRSRFLAGLRSGLRRRMVDARIGWEESA